MTRGEPLAAHARRGVRETRRRRNRRSREHDEEEGKHGNGGRGFILPYTEPDEVGEVVLTFNSDGLSWKSVEPLDNMTKYVFVHPWSAKGNGCRTWETVAHAFSRAKANTKVIVTERAGQAFNMMLSITNKELTSYNGVVAVGGDGFVNGFLNGFLSSRLKGSEPPAPAYCIHSVKNNREPLADDANETVEETCNQSEDNLPLLSSPTENGSRISNSNSTDKDHEFPISNDWFRFGIIPAGSTDAIVICTTESRDPITSSLHIVLGKRVHLDIAKVVRWKTISRAAVEPCVHYAACFAWYRFYGDVITESNKSAWIDPKRYDYAGMMVFLKAQIWKTWNSGRNGDTRSKP